MTMIERVAFGLAIRFGYMNAHGTHEEAWANMRADNSPGYRLCIEAARAAMETMREPTEAVGREAFNHVVTNDWLDFLRGYRAMIDAALEETK